MEAGQLAIPQALRETASREGRGAWLSGLPATVSDLAARWSLEVAEPYEPGGQTAWVAPVRRSSGEPAVLKVRFAHFEADHETDGLRAWDGDGAVRLYESVDVADGVALLLERCIPGTELRLRPEPEQDEAVAGLLRRLWRDPGEGSPFRPLATMCAEWADGYERCSTEERAVIDPALAREGIELFRSLPATADRCVLLCTDLHAGNVLAAEREPFLMIDPKPYAGDPTYDVLQHLLNCEDRLAADPGGLADRMAALCDLDPARLRLWLFARCVQESPHWPGLADVALKLAPS